VARGDPVFNLLIEVEVMGGAHSNTLHLRRCALAGAIALVCFCTRDRDYTSFVARGRRRPGY
jgi:hypothetical protein